MYNTHNMFSPMDDFWEKENERMIIKENYDKIMEHYEAIATADKLAEQPEKYVIYRGTPNNWEIQTYMDKFLYYVLYFNRKQLNIRTQCKISMPYIEIWDIQKYFGPSFREIFEIALKQEILGQLNNIPINLILQDVMVDSYNDPCTMNQVLGFRMILTLPSVYSVNIENLKTLENIMPLIQRSAKDIIKKIEHELRYRFEEEMRWKTNTMR